MEKDPSPATWRRRARVAAALVPIGAVFAAAVFFAPQNPAQGDTADVVRDGDFCPVDGSRIAGSATYLLDLAKPLADAKTPGRLLRDVTRELGADVELRVFALAADANAPRELVDRLCKPYHEAAIRSQAAKDKGRRDCDDLPAQLSVALRDRASGFCVRRNALAARIGQLAANSPRQVNDAYLLEAIEETARALARRPNPRKLYIFSDMIQHAAWYSHVDLPWPGWNFAAFSLLASPGEAPLESGVFERVPNLDVTVFYPIRRGRTEPLRPRHAHQTFWRSYFREVRGTEVAFRQLPLAPRYDAPRLMPRPTAGIEKDIEEVQRTIDKLLARRAEAAAVKPPDVEEPKTPQLAAAPPPDATPPRSAPPETAGGPVASAPTRASARTSRPPPRRAPPETAGEPVASVPPRASARTSRPPPPARTPPDTVASAELAVAAVEAPPPASPSNLSEPEPEPVPPGLPLCAVSLLPGFAPSLVPDTYPGDRRVNYGTGVVTVQYSLDAQGNTTDVRARVDSPSRPSAADRLASDTVAEVQRWQFAFGAAPLGGCTLPAQQVATFTYGQKCVGSPAPSCRTVRASVAVR